MNSGSAVIINGGKRRVLTPGHIYLFPQCNDCQPLESNAFDHTFFDFTSNIIYDNNMFIEIAADDCCTYIFSFVNAIISHKNSYNATLLKLLEAVLEYINQKFDAPVLKSNLLVDVMSYIYKNSATVNTSELANKFNLNKSHFIRLFKKHIGTTPMKFVYSCRLAMGFRYLKEGKNVCEAAELCGYTSATAFCVAFKKQYGVLPSEMR